MWSLGHFMIEHPLVAFLSGYGLLFIGCIGMAICAAKAISKKDTH